jgi:hypothetical protein
MVSYGIEQFSVEIAHLLQRREELEFKTSLTFLTQGPGFFKHWQRETFL